MSRGTGARGVGETRPVTSRRHDAGIIAPALQHGGMSGVRAEPQRSLSRSLVAIMAVATGLSVANNYYAQPLLPAIGRALHASTSVSGLVVTAAQVGYALGLLFVLPLGDLVERRRLIVVLSLATACVLVWVGLAPSMAWLLPAALAVGTMSVLAQVIVPFAAGLANDQDRGQVVGTVMSGLLVGILLARTIAGWLAETGTWRAVYFVAAVVMVAQAAVLAAKLPTWRRPAPLSYPRLVASVVRLLREEPVLRLRSAYGMFSFATFSALWTSLAFVLARNYHYSSGIIGMFGLVGAAGAVAASAAGRFADRGWQWRTTGASTVILAGSWTLIWDGRRSIVAMIIGLALFDLAAQALHITNQSEIYRLRPEARSRLTSAYMFLYFVGGAGGSLLSAALYGTYGWAGPCAAGAGLATCAFLLWVTTSALRLPAAVGRRP